MINGWRSVSALVAVAVAAHRVTDVLRWKKAENAQPTRNALVAVQSLNAEGALRAPINGVQISNVPAREPREGQQHKMV